MANLARKPDKGGRPASSRAQAMKLHAQDGHRRRNGDADLVRLELLLLALAEGLQRHGQHVGADLAAALDQLDQEEEGGDAQGRS